MEHDSDYEDDDAKEKKENADAVRKKYAVLLGEATGDENVNEDGDMMMTYTTESTEVKKTKKDKKDKEEEERNKAELELLLMDDINENEKKKAPRRINNDDVVVKKKGGKKSKKDKMDKNFQVDLSDDRFTPVLDSHDFDVDPSNPEYVATRGMKQILKEKHKRFEKKMRNKKQTK
ncbi:ESF1-like protein [Entamoeba marina]